MIDELERVDIYPGFQLVLTSGTTPGHVPRSVVALDAGGRQLVIGEGSTPEMACRAAANVLGQGRDFALQLKGRYTK